MSGASRHYFLPLEPHCLEGCDICDAMGCRNEGSRSLEAVRNIVERARLGGFDTLLFSSALLARVDADEIVDLCLREGLRPGLQLHWPLLARFRARVQGWQARGLHLALVFTGEETGEIDLSAIDRHLTSFTLTPNQNSPVLEFLRALRPQLNEIHLNFPPYSSGSRFLRAKKVYATLEKIKKELPSLGIAPPLGREVWDPRISPALPLDADLAPVFSLSAGASPLISVVIPSFNSAPLLKNVVRHLLLQNLERTKFEIIIVDDGSTDGSRELLQNFLAPEAGNLELKYFYFPRVKARSRGDGNFRAGIARNQGVKHSRGGILAFLDSDIIVPPDYLTDLLEKHQRWDVIQAIRLHLKRPKNKAPVDYAKVEAKDTFVLEDRYWAPFFRVGDWQSLPFFWKYTCTYGLSVKTELFKRAGWFRKTFVYYGFEDTDLGYRLAREGARFLLNQKVTYHLPSEEDRSEYRQSKVERHLLLGKTAKVFFLNTLDGEVFQHFGNFMGHERDAKQLFLDARKRLKRYVGDAFFSARQ